MDSEAFAQSCIRFYIEIISKLSIRRTAPEDELILKLLDTVFTTGPENVGLETKDLTPFLKSKNDSVPVVRSFLLQLLLRNKWETIIPYLYLLMRFLIVMIKPENTSEHILRRLNQLEDKMYKNSYKFCIVSCMRYYAVVV